MTILAGYVGGLTGDDHAVDGFMQKGAEVFAVLSELADFVYCSVASLRSGLHMLSFKPLSWGHVPRLGADWSLATHSPSSRSSSRGQNPALAGAIAPRGHRDTEEMGGSQPGLQIIWEAAAVMRCQDLLFSSYMANQQLLHNTHQATQWSI